MNTLILCVGLPRSGKTTWARAQGFPIVNPDSIRLALHGQRFQLLAEPFVWALTKVMVRALFLAGHSTVILDATNGTRARRDEWHSDEWVTGFQVFTATVFECIQRARAQHDDYIVPVIERMAAEWQPIDIDEYR